MSEPNSWGFAHMKINHLVHCLEGGTTTSDGHRVELTDEQKASRRRLAKLLHRVADAMRAIEFVDSAESPTPSDVLVINALFDEFFGNTLESKHEAGEKLSEWVSQR